MKFKLTSTWIRKKHRLVAAPTETPCRSVGELSRPLFKRKNTPPSFFIIKMKSLRHHNVCVFVCECLCVFSTSLNYPVSQEQQLEKKNSPVLNRLWQERNDCWVTTTTSVCQRTATTYTHSHKHTHTHTQAGQKMISESN